MSVVLLSQLMFLVTAMSDLASLTGWLVSPTGLRMATSCLFFAYSVNFLAFVTLVFHSGDLLLRSPSSTGCLFGSTRAIRSCALDPILDLE